MLRTSSRPPTPTHVVSDSTRRLSSGRLDARATLRLGNFYTGSHLRIRHLASVGIARAAERDIPDISQQGTPGKSRHITAMLRSVWLVPSYCMSLYWYLLFRMLRTPLTFLAERRQKASWWSPALPCAAGRRCSPQTPGSPTPCASSIPCPRRSTSASSPSLWAGPGP